MNIEIPKLSFCITCKNRFHQIKKTLSKNLNENRMFKHLIEFVLVDFGSTDGLNEWVKKNHMEDITEGYLKYFYTDELHNWHASIAKNTSHLFAQHEILVNLDCDNYTGNNGGKYLIQQFLKHGKSTIVHQFSGVWFDGSFGRLGVYRKNFMEIRGYDESLQPMGYQDLDLLNRLRSLGLKYICIPNSEYNQAISNSKDEGIHNTNSNLIWNEMNSKNEIKSIDNISNGRLVVNNNSWGIRENVYDVFGNRVEIKNIQYV